MAMSERFSRMQAVYADALKYAPALVARFAEAGLSPADLVDQAALDRLAVLKKERLLELQASDPPFAGFLSCDAAELRHIFVSPGPIFEPSHVDDATGHGMNKMFEAAGIGRGDVALNTWSYHLVPAGLLFEQGLKAVGATVIPAGTGNTELQAELLVKLRPSAFLGSTAHFAKLVEILETTGRSLPAEWNLKHAFLGGEFGDWTAKRQAIERRLALKTWSCYGTADLGLVGYESADCAGYLVHPDRYVEICDPVTGLPLPQGASGEIIVTTLSRGWPMIRFGTGDVARALDLADDGGAARISNLEGRVGAAVKAREIFIYPSHVQALAVRVEGLREARVAIGQRDGRDEITIELLAEDPAMQALLEAPVAAAFRMLTRLRPDMLHFVSSDQAFSIGELLEDKRDFRASADGGGRS
jgi:phenylacetate-CoA ligase